MKIISSIFNKKRRFHKAVRKNNYLSVKKYIDKGLDLEVTDDSGSTALMISSKEGHFEILKLLLQYGANINTKKQ